MLEQLSVLPPDPILGLAAACRADPNPDKIDLTVGVYMDEDGICPVFEAVKLNATDSPDSTSFACSCTAKATL